MRVEPTPMWRISANCLKRHCMQCWLRFRGGCSMRLTAQPCGWREYYLVDCATLRALRNMMAEQCVSTEVAVVQPLLSRQAGHGDTDGTDSKRTSNGTAGAVRRTPSRTTLGRSHSIDAQRTGKASGATPNRRSGEQSKSRSAKPRRVR
jgi:hypothetical protein